MDALVSADDHLLPFPAAFSGCLFRLPFPATFSQGNEGKSKTLCRKERVSPAHTWFTPMVDPGYIDWVLSEKSALTLWADFSF
jgi:hypothetical protein